MNDLEKLEKLYVPSFHTKRFGSRQELLAHFDKFTKEESYKNRIKYECHLNIAYGVNKREKLDIYGENLPPNSPILIFVHGGYWVHVDKEDCAFIVTPFVEKGIRVIIVDHSICVALEKIIKEIKKCFFWIADYVNINNITQIGVAGHCAGAHLISYALSENFFEKISANVTVDAFFLSGIYYLDEMRHFEETNRKNVLEISNENVNELSPLYNDFDYLKNYKFSAYIFVGVEESRKFKEHSRVFAERMSWYLVNYKELDCDHFSMVEYLSKFDFELTRIILERFK